MLRSAKKWSTLVLCLLFIGFVCTEVSANNGIFGVRGLVAARREGRAGCSGAGQYQAQVQKQHTGLAYQSSDISARVGGSCSRSRIFFRGR